MNAASTLYERGANGVDPRLRAAGAYHQSRDYPGAQGHQG
jgi:hypothetical protein